jgi:MoaA/NifB/PqqE/SkfB family radical SAM enzyme
MRHIENDANLFSKAKLAASNTANPGIDFMFTPQGDTPVCNQSCNGCYYFANYKPGEKAISSGNIPNLALGLAESGYHNLFLTTSELLLASNWEELLRATGNKYVNTNGRIIVTRGEAILDRMANAGVEQIVITANITRSHQSLNLVPQNVVETAFRKINSYNASHPDNTFGTEATVIMTAENYDRVVEMGDYVHDVYQANAVKFIAYMVVDGKGGLPELMPSKLQLAMVAEQIAKLREKFNLDEFYVQRGGSLGTQGLTSEKLEGLCPAGDALRSVKSFAEGAEVTPCIYIPQVRIGQIEGGKVVIDAGKLGEFTDFKTRALDEGLCPAFAINSRSSYVNS